VDRPSGADWVGQSLSLHGRTVTGEGRWQPGGEGRPCCIARGDGLLEADIGFTTGKGGKKASLVPSRLSGRGVEVGGELFLRHLTGCESEALAQLDR